MFILMTYDISDSPRRLHKVAKIAEKYGIRVQNSVFELEVDISELTKLKQEISKVINMQCDSIRFYKLGKNYKNNIDILGSCKSIELSQDKSFIF